MLCSRLEKGEDHSRVTMKALLKKKWKEIRELGQEWDQLLKSD